MESGKWNQVEQWKSVKLFAEMEKMIEESSINPEKGDYIDVFHHTEQVIRFRIVEMVKDAHTGEMAEHYADINDYESTLGALEARIDAFRGNTLGRGVYRDDVGPYIEILLLDIPAKDKVLSE